MAILFALPGLIVGCDCGDPSTNSGQADDDDVEDDDDASDDDDDTTPDDEDNDDDVTDDDDDVTDDDDSDDDDTEQIDYFCPEDGSLDVGDIHLEYITGGLPGTWGTSMAIAPDGTRYAATTKGRALYIHSDDGSDTWTSPPECLVWFAEWPDIAVDSDGFVHLTYHDSRTYALKYANNTSGDWIITTVDDQDNKEIDYWVGEYSSLALDTNGSVHISYFDFQNKALKYATNKSGSWIIKTVPSLGLVGMFTSIAVDGSGAAHIGHTEFTDISFSAFPYYATNESGHWSNRFLGLPGNYGVSVALDSKDKVHIIYSFVDYFYDGIVLHSTNASGQWVTQTVHGNSDYGNFPSLGIDSNDFLHVVYQSNYPPSVQPVYANNIAGTWEIQGIPSSIFADGKYSSLAIDPDDMVHFSHHNYNDMEAKVTTNQSGVWETSVLASGERFDQSSMAMDSQGLVHISFYDNLYYRLIYATNSSGEWQIATVDTNGNVGGFNSIAIDGNNHPHISYYDYDNAQLKFASNFTGNWATATIDSSVGSGRYSSLVFDESGFAHISYEYWGSSNSVLKYTTNTSGVWQDETIDSDGETGMNTSITLDSLGNIHVSYVKSYSDSDLMYATNLSGFWETEVIDSYSLVERATSIALDAQDKVHIAYFDTLHLNRNLMYATNTSGTWKTEIVDDVYALFEYASNTIGVDSGGNTHICYNHWKNIDLKYATNIGGTWNSSTIDNAGGSGYSASMVIDEDEMIHVVHISDGLWYTVFPVGLPD